MSKWGFFSVVVLIGTAIFVGWQASEGNMTAIAFLLTLGVLTCVGVGVLMQAFATRALGGVLQRVLQVNQVENAQVARDIREGQRALTEGFKMMSAAQRAGMLPQPESLPLSGPEMPGRFYDSEMMFEALDAEDRRHRNGTAPQPPDDDETDL
jgi:hypothetical protein